MSWNQHRENKEKKPIKPEAGSLKLVIKLINP